MLERSGIDGTTRVLVDASPDLRDQMLTTGVHEIDGVWFTHEHADHTHGIDELRAFYLQTRKKVNIWADAPTSSMLMTRFAYCFLTPQGSDYPAILNHNAIHAGQPFSTPGAGGSLSALPFEVTHGNINALGFRVGNMAYTPDLSDIPAKAASCLMGLDLWVVDALRRTPHPSHFSLSETLGWIERLKPRRAILTNMHIDLDFATLRRELPANVEPAYDGMSIEF
jgi:phosphoribosyl 1,2-cyclic phosphate phosphodiesterase